MFEENNPTPVEHDKSSMSEVKQTRNFQSLYQKSKSNNQQLIEQIAGLRHAVDLLVGSEVTEACPKRPEDSLNNIMDALFLEQADTEDLLSEFDNQLQRLKKIID